MSDYVTTMWKMKTLLSLKFFSWNQLFSNFFGKKRYFHEIFAKNVNLNTLMMVNSYDF